MLLIGERKSTKLSQLKVLHS